MRQATEGETVVGMHLRKCKDNVRFYISCLYVSAHMIIFFHRPQTVPENLK